MLVNAKQIVNSYLCGGHIFQRTSQRCKAALRLGESLYVGVVLFGGRLKDPPTITRRLGWADRGVVAAGPSEFILIDQMTQCYVMQLHWVEEAMRRSCEQPRVESYSYQQWRERQKAGAAPG